VFKFDWPLSEVFTVVEESPEYPGGTGALIKFIQTNLIAPNSVLQGKVHLKFVVNELGDISRIDILQGLNEECDAEAIRVVKLMPRWKPGKQNGQPVKVYYNLPISFRIR
jgi:protein TonB